MRITTNTGETLLPFTSSVLHPASTLTSFTTDSPSTMVLPTLTVTPGKCYKQNVGFRFRFIT